MSDKPVLIKVKAEALVRAVDAVAAIPERKASISILEHALLSVGKDGRASVLMTDLEIEGQAWLDTSTSAPWTGILPSEIVAFVRARPEGEIGLAIAADGSSIKASQGRGRMTVAILTADDFPRLTAPKETFSFRLPAAELCDALARVVGAVEPANGRMFLQGVNIRYQPASEATDSEAKLAKGSADSEAKPKLANKKAAKLIFTATNGYAVHREAIHAPDGAADMPPLIVPTKSVNAILKAFANRASDVTIGGEGERISVKTDDIAIVTKLIEAVYPDVDRIIPKPSNTGIRVDAKELSASLTRMRALKDNSAKGSGGRGMRIGFNDGVLSLSITRKGTDDRIEDEVAGESTGEWSNGLNPELLQTALSQTGVKDVTLTPSEASTPSVLLDTGTPDRLFLIMCRTVF